MSGSRGSDETNGSGSAERVFAILADGWWYRDWVVGTARVLLGLRNKINEVLPHRRNVEPLRRPADIGERAHGRRAALR